MENDTNKFTQSKHIKGNVKSIYTFIWLSSKGKSLCHYEETHATVARDPLGHRYPLSQCGTAVRPMYITLWNQMHNRYTTHVCALRSSKSNINQICKSHSWDNTIIFINYGLWDHISINTIINYNTNNNCYKLEITTYWKYIMNTNLTNKQILIHLDHSFGRLIWITHLND